LRIIGDEFAGKGVCDRCIEEIAARAGTCRTTVQNAIRMAAREGLLTVQERRRPGRKNLPNLVRIVSREWLAWLARGERRARQESPQAVPLIAMHPRDQWRGFKKTGTTDNRFKKLSGTGVEPPARSAFNPKLGK